jgi:ABC-type nitrate/sulfonate/bicarbonate transport system permease component
MRSTQRLIDVGLGFAGIAAFLVMWQIIGQYRLVGLTWPTLTSVLGTLFDPDRTPLFLRATGATFLAAGCGLVIGGVFGVGIAVVVHLLPPLRPGVDRMATIINALPGIALGPILIVTLGARTTPMALSTINVFFLIYVAARTGLMAAARVDHDLFSVLGANKVVRLWRLELPAAIPTIASGSRLALSAAMIGAILGEWFGAPHGLGLIIIGAMQNFNIPLLWSAVLLISAASILLYGLATLLEASAYRKFR